MIMKTRNLAQMVWLPTIWMMLALIWVRPANMQANPLPTVAFTNVLTDVKLIGGSYDEVNALKATYKKQGWTVIEKNLNAGTRGDYIYLCYKMSKKSASEYITALYLSSGSNPVSNTIKVNGRTYTLCPYEGGSHFKSVKGDLNSNCGGDDIHIYYTKDAFEDGRAVYDVKFNAMSKGAICKDSSTTPYDLNKGAGGEDIFMHVTSIPSNSQLSDTDHVAKPNTDNTKKSDNTSKPSDTSTSGDTDAKDGYITDVKLIGGSLNEVNALKATYKKQGWTVVESNLNGGAGGDYIYLCYKTSKKAVSEYITALYLSSGSNPVSNTIKVNGRTYTLCPYEGGSHFKSVKGDLNSNCGGDDIHIYYTKDVFDDSRAIYDVKFNATSKGAICKDSSSTPYDLNKGAGGNDIFMHVSSIANKTQGENTNQTTKPNSDNTKKSDNTSKPSDTSTSDKEAQYRCITDVKLIGGSLNEVNALKATYKKQGWTIVESNLNEGTGGDYIYLCYKTSKKSADEYITALYLSSGSNPVPNTIKVNGRTYTLCPYEGGSHFKSVKGDLNSNCGGDDIHIYYTKDEFDDHRTIFDVNFNASSKSAICKDSSTTPYDLNKGAGGKDIFMHITKVIK